MYEFVDSFKFSQTFDALQISVFTSFGSKTNRYLSTQNGENQTFKMFFFWFNNNKRILVRESHRQLRL